MKRFAALFLLILSFGLCSGQTWTNISVSSRVSIGFPDKPDIEEQDGRTIYGFFQEGYGMIVAVMDMGATPGFDVNQSQVDHFYEGLVNGKITAADGVILRNEKTYLGDYEARDIQYTRKLNGIDNTLVSTKFVLIDKVLFSFDFWDMSTNRHDKEVTRFFESIELK